MSGLAENDALGEGWERVHRDLTSRLGFGDGITEPMADNDTIVEFVEQLLMEASEHHGCPVVCELCGETLAATTCEHCHGSGGNNALIEATLAYSECEWCAGVGKVHVGCVGRSYADLATSLISPAEPCTDCTSPAEVTDCPADTGDRCGPCHVASCAECQDGLADQDAAESRSDGRWT